MYSDGDCGLADETKQKPFPCRLTYRVGPPASSAKLFTGQKLTSDIYVYVRRVYSYWAVIRRSTTWMLKTDGNGGAYFHFTLMKCFNLY